MTSIEAGETPSAAQIRRRIANAIHDEKSALIEHPRRKSDLTLSEQEKEQARGGRVLQHWGYSQAERAAVTTELVEMLVAWERFPVLPADATLIVTPRKPPK